MSYAQQQNEPQASFQQNSVAHESNIDIQVPLPLRNPSTFNHPFISGNLIVPQNAEFIDNTDPEKFGPELRFMPLADQLYEELVEPIKQAVKQYPDTNVINALDRLDTIEYNEYHKFFKDLNNEKNKIITSIPQNTKYLKAIDDSIQTLQLSWLQSIVSCIRSCLSSNTTWTQFYNNSEGLQKLIPDLSKAYNKPKDRSEIQRNAIFNSLDNIGAPIFPHSPCKKDVQQYGFGDCYLLAALISILSLPNGSDIIQDMFLDCGEYAIVRVFLPSNEECSGCQTCAGCSPVCNNFDKLELVPKYIKLNKALNFANPESALWVHLLEKAIAATVGANAFSDSKKRIVDTASGSPAKALMHFTGKKYTVLKKDFFSDHEFTSNFLPTVAGFEDDFECEDGSGINIKILKNHSYAVLEIRNDYVCLENPHSAKRRTEYNEKNPLRTFLIPLQEFYTHLHSIFVDNDNLQSN